MAGAFGIVQVRTNADIEAEQARQDRARVESEDAANAAAESVIDQLAQFCWKEFTSARDAKQMVHESMLSDLRARKCEYDPEILALIKEAGGGSEICPPLIKEKVAAAAAWLCDLFLNERPFSVEPTPIPDLPPQVQAAIEQDALAQFQQYGPMYADSPQALRDRVQEMRDEMLTKAREWALRRAKHNEDKVDDVLTEGGFYTALKPAIDDACALRGGIIRGPSVRRKTRLQWSPSGTGAVIDNSPMRCFDHVSPFDIYPQGGIMDFDSGHVSERQRMSPVEVYDLIGVDGFREECVREMLARNGTAGMRNWWWGDSERQRLEGNSGGQWMETPDGLFDVILHHTTVMGSMLQDWGVPAEEVPDREKPYRVMIWMGSPTSVLGVKLNDDPLGARPYYKFGFRKVPGSFWYESVHEVIRPLYLACAAAMRSIMNNMAMSAGYITEMQGDRLPTGTQVKQPMPFDVIETVAPKSGTAGPAVYMHQPAVNVQAYMAVYEMFSNIADAVLGLPSFLSGAQIGPGGAAGTSSGLAQLREMATRTFKYTVSEVDAAVAALVDRIHTELVLEGKDPMMNGDVNCKARGSIAFMNRTNTQIRLNELLQSTMNPVDTQIMGPPGRAELLRAVIKGFDGIDPERIIPSRDQIIAQAKQAAMMQLQQQVAAGQQQPEAPRAAMPDGSVSGDQRVVA